MSNMTDGMNKAHLTSAKDMVSGAWDTFATVGIKSDGMTATTGTLKGGECHKCQKEVVLNDNGLGHVRAKGKLFHAECFKCHTCDKYLQMDTSYELDGKFFCSEHNPTQGDFKCSACSKQIAGERMDAVNQHYHANCFRCSECDISLTDKPYRHEAGKLFCKLDYKLKYPEKAAALHKQEAAQCFCAQCNEHIVDEFLESELKKFHIHCFDEYKKTAVQAASKTCSGCNKPANTWIEVSDKFFHAECWKCHNCECVLEQSNAGIKKGKFWCKACIADPFRDY